VTQRLYNIKRYDDYDHCENMQIERIEMGRTCHTHRITMIYKGEPSSVSQEESAPEGEPGCAGKME